MERKSCVFGPIHSRRLGVSLGVDLVVPKTCSLDCIYCEAGKTTNLTSHRKAYVSLNKVKDELAAVLNRGPQLDYITFSGAGEPTLNSEFLNVARWIRENYPQYKICLLTNGLLLGDKTIIESTKYLDVVIPSCDASNEEEFKIINRPVSSCQFDTYLSDLVNFTWKCECRVELEIFIVPNINDSDDSIGRFVDIVSQMRIARVQLNTIDRPGVEKNISAPSIDVLRKFISRLEAVVPVEVVGAIRYFSRVGISKLDATEQRIIDMIIRRPATAEDIVNAFSVDKERLQTILDSLVRRGEIMSEKKARGLFYEAVNRN